MELNTQVANDEDASLARIRVEGVLNTETAPAFERSLQGVMAGRHQLVVLDLAGLDYISAPGLRVIFRAAKETAGQGRRLAAVNRRPHTDKVFQILRALPDMAVFDTDEELESYLAGWRDGDE